MPLDQPDVGAWLDLARADLAMADLALADVHATPAMFGLVCFHAQQAAEKVLKAAVILHGAPVPRSHSLVLLTDVVARGNHVSEDILVAAAALNEYGVGPRYPGVRPPSSRAEALAARSAANVVIAWAMQWLDSAVPEH